MMTPAQQYPFKAWLTVICGMIINFNLGCLYAFSIWHAELLKIKMMSAADGALIFTIAVGCFAVGGCLGGLMTDLLGGRVPALGGAAAILVGLSTAGLGVKNSSYLTFLVGFGIVANLGQGLAFGAAVPAALKWFRNHLAGLVVGLVVGTYALQGMIVSPSLKWIINASSLVTSFWVLAVVYFFFIGASAVGLMTVPSAYPRTGDFGSPEPSPRDATLGQALTSPQFYLWLGIFWIGCSAALLTIGNVSFRAYRMIGKPSFGIIWLLVIFGSIFNILGRLLSGLISDFTGRHWPIIVIFALASLGAFLTPAAINGEMPVLALIITFLGFYLYGSIFSLMPAAVVDNFGSRFVGTVFGLIFLVGYGLYGIIPGFIRVISTNASPQAQLSIKFYFMGFVLLAGVTLGIVSMILARKQPALLYRESVVAATVSAPSPVEYAGGTYVPPLYAGFWKRVLAYCIDSIVVSLPLSIFWVIIFAFLSMAFSGQRDRAGVMAIVMIPIYLSFIVGPWLYFAFMESSARQATLGKMALGVIVTDLEGRRISFGRASGRFWGKIVSCLIFYVGFMMAGWTARKQALHDMMADTLVINRIRAYEVKGGAAPPEEPPTEFRGKS